MNKDINTQALNQVEQFREDMDVFALASECLKNTEFVNEYCRLANVKRPDRLAPIDRIIDEACGHNAGEEFIRGFVAFVREFVYPLMPQAQQ